MLSRYVWRHPSYPGRTIGAVRTFIDTGYKPELVMAWCQAKYVEHMKRRGVRHMHPYGAPVLPVRSKSVERGQGHHPIDLETGVATMKHRRHAPPARVWVESNPLKDVIYDSVFRDSRLPEGAERVNQWPADAVARGYTDWWFREFSNEIKTAYVTPGGKAQVKWKVRVGEAKKNEAWDCRVYALAAAMFNVWPKPLREGLVDVALREAERVGYETPFDAVVDDLRLDASRSRGYSSNNIFPIAGD